MSFDNCRKAFPQLSKGLATIVVRPFDNCRKPNQPNRNLKNFPADDVFIAYNFKTGRMENLKVVFSINDDTKWEHLLGDVLGMAAATEFVNKVAVVAMGTSILTLLKSTRLDALKTKIHEAKDKGVDFYICIGTMRKYGIVKEQLLDEFQVAESGADIKILQLNALGYQLLTARDT